MGTSVPRAEKEAVRAYKPPAGKALIYIYRPYSFYSSALAKGVWVNRQKAGSNGPGTFIAVPVAPGVYEVQAGGMPLVGLNACNGSRRPLQLKAMAGKCYYIRQNLTSHSSGSFLVYAGGVAVPASNDTVIYVAEVVDEQQGRLETSKCRYVGTQVRF